MKFIISTQMFHPAKMILLFLAALTSARLTLRCFPLRAADIRIPTCLQLASACGFLLELMSPPVTHLRFDVPLWPPPPPRQGPETHWWFIYVGDLLLLLPPLPAQTLPQRHTLTRWLFMSVGETVCDSDAKWGILSPGAMRYTVQVATHILSLSSASHAEMTAFILSCI